MSEIGSAKQLKKSVVKKALKYSIKKVIQLCDILIQFFKLLSSILIYSLSSCCKNNKSVNSNDVPNALTNYNQTNNYSNGVVRRERTNNQMNYNQTTNNPNTFERRQTNRQYNSFENGDVYSSVENPVGCIMFSDSSFNFIKK